jgi:hypothetical protein
MGLTPAHGVDVGGLPALVLLLVGGVSGRSQSMNSRSD